MKSELNYLQILQENKNFTEKEFKKTISVEILSNITLNNITEVLGYFLRVNDIQLQFFLGGYDAILPDSFSINNSSASVTLIFWESSNFTNGLNYKIELWDDHEVEKFISEKCKEIEQVINNLKNKKLVLFNKFSSLIFTNNEILQSKFEIICKRLNNHLEKIKSTNLIIIDIDKVIAEVGISNSFNKRQYISSKSLYTPSYIIQYVQFILPSILSISGSIKKALILDCDNTLWNGILGEDGIENVKMSSEDGGQYFEEVQHIIVSLAKKGVIICLCSKNNISEVDEIFMKRMKVLTYEHIVAKKINWESKASNIKALAKELNIGVDSMVFVDDSKFEINLVKELLPQVKTYIVPSDASSYPEVMRKVATDFFKIQYTDEDTMRIKMYQIESERNVDRNSFGDINTYIDNLGLEIVIFKNNHEHLSRIVQLCQKTNQFNISTKRYTEGEIESFLKQPEKYDLYTFLVKDKYGEYGIVGLAIISYTKPNVGFLDTWLMSCRVMGRNIEYAFFDFIISELKKSNVNKLQTVYSKTIKNIPVSGIFETLGFTLESSKSNFNDLNYHIELVSYSKKNINKIKTTNYEK